MNISVTQFAQAPAIVAAADQSGMRSSIRWSRDPGERLRTKSPSILHGISTIYRRRCGLSLSGVTSVYSCW